MSWHPAAKVDVPFTNFPDIAERLVSAYGSEANGAVVKLWDADVDRYRHVQRWEVSDPEACQARVAGLLGDIEHGKRWITVYVSLEVEPFPGFPYEPTMELYGPETLQVALESREVDTLPTVRGLGVVGRDVLSGQVEPFLYDLLLAVAPG